MCLWFYRVVPRFFSNCIDFIKMEAGLYVNEYLDLTKRRYTEQVVM